MSSILLLLHQSALGQLFPLRSGTAIVGIGPDGDAATGREDAAHFEILWVHEPHEVLHDDVYAILMEVAVVAEGEEVELQTLRLHHALVGDVADAYLGR